MFQEILQWIQDTVSIGREWHLLLIHGVIETVKLFFSVLALELPVAFTLGLCRLSSSGPIRMAATWIVNLFRGISLYVVLFWLYFALPNLGVTFSAWSAAVIGIALVQGAYASEYVRSAILAVPHGQQEAAIALSMSKYQRMRHIILPQALVIMLPLCGNDLIFLLKATATSSLITVPELTDAGMSINVATYSAHAFSVFMVLLLIYFILAQLISTAVRFTEMRLGRWKHGV